jgi:hypothetical protein
MHFFASSSDCAAFDWLFRVMYLTWWPRMPPWASMYLKYGGLAVTVRPGDRARVALGDGERGVVHRDHVPVGDRQPGHGERGACRGPRPRVLA